MSWIETQNGNRISKLAVITRPDKITIGSNTTIHDLAELRLDTACPITLGKYCFLDRACIVDPVSHPILIGAYCIIGESTVVLLSTLGSRILIERDCHLGANSVIYDSCFIRANTVVPPRMVIPPFSEVMGVPGKGFTIKPLNTSYKRLIEAEARSLHVLGT